MPFLLELCALQAGVGPADFTTIRGLVGVVLGVGALIFFHELGHFLAAKWAGVRVEVFSLGIGQRLFGYVYGDTDYRVSALPLGGYVRMLGQADEDPNQPRTSDPADFRNKSAGQRFVILVAGVFMNLVLAAVGFIAAFGLGIDFTAPEIGSIQPGSAASRADLRPGDVIVKVDGDEVLSFQDLSTLIAISSGEVSLDVLRDGKVHTTRATPLRGERDTYPRLGVRPAYAVAAVEEGSPLAQAGLQPATARRSDRILNISPIESRCDPARMMSGTEINQAIEEAQGKLAIGVARTHYDERGRPERTEQLGFDVEVERRSEWGIGVALPDRAYVRHVQADSAAARAGLEPGDRIVSLGSFPEIKHSTLRESIQELGARAGEVPLPLVVERPQAEGGTARVELQVTLELQNKGLVAKALEGVSDPEEQVRLRRDVGRWLLGVEYRSDVLEQPCRLPLADPEAEPVELAAGDRLLGVWHSGGLWWSGYDENAVASPRMLRLFLRDRRDEPFRLAWQPSGSDETRTAVLRAAELPDETYAHLGLLETDRKVRIKRGPLDACLLGMQQTIIQTHRIVMMLRSFITGSVSPKELGGPIQIVNVAYQVAKEDTLAKLLHLLAILSVNLAVLNLLPIPILDGGHIFFLAIEKLKGRPVSNDVLSYAQLVGLVCLIGLMALVFFNDIRRVLQ